MDEVAGVTTAWATGKGASAEAGSEVGAGLRATAGEFICDTVTAAGTAVGGADFCPAVIGWLATGPAVGLVAGLLGAAGRVATVTGRAASFGLDGSAGFFAASTAGAAARRGTALGSSVAPDGWGWARDERAGPGET
jgi:hypothetical protein